MVVVEKGVYIVNFCQQLVDCSVFFTSVQLKSPPPPPPPPWRLRQKYCHYWGHFTLLLVWIQFYLCMLSVTCLYDIGCASRKCTSCLEFTGTGTYMCTCVCFISCACGKKPDEPRQLCLCVWPRQCLRYDMYASQPFSQALLVQTWSVWNEGWLIACVSQVLGEWAVPLAPLVIVVGWTQLIEAMHWQKICSKALAT